MSDQIEVLQKKLHSVKDNEGVIGYIIRSSTSASVDLEDSTKIIDYALLSSTALEVGQALCTIFEIGEVDTILLESEDKRVLSTMDDHHRLSVFMKRGVDHEGILKHLRADA